MFSMVVDRRLPTRTGAQRHTPLPLIFISLRNLIGLLCISPINTPPRKVPTSQFGATLMGCPCMCVINKA